MKQWKLGTCDKCPRCQETGETKMHIFKCQAEEAKKTWTTALQSLDDWLKTWVHLYDET